MNNNIIPSIKFAAIFMVILFAFAACGNDSDSSVNGPAKVSEVKTAVELGKCTDSRLGETVLVTENDSYYTCIKGKWITVDESEKLDKSSSSHSADTATSNISSSSNGKTISGFAQKGPFLNGSSVTLYELNGTSLEKTGKTFKGKVINDRGEFNIADVPPTIRYALLEVSGYYRNEVTGTKTGKKIKLNALTDFSKREKANINVLTHLEYKRVLYLVGTGMSVVAAKKQAETEIFKAFGIADEFDLAEDLSIFVTLNEKGNIALLALSVLLQGGRTEEELSKLLDDIATDLEKDGEWNDETTKAKIADWARVKSLDSIKTNIKAWRIGTTGANIEKYVRNFWYTNYGLGACTEKRTGEVAATTNKHSATYGTQMRFICNKAPFKNNLWAGASDIEKDTYGEKCTKIGQIINGKVVETNKYYCTAKGWVSLLGWSWEVPKEIYLNPKISYETLTDTRDGKKYKTVKIGKLTWMAENLNYSDSVATPSLKGKSWCYDNVAAHCDVSGRLYTWAAAIDSVKLANDKDNPQTCGFGHICFSGICGNANSCSRPLMVQGVCPEGWHLPRDDEWRMLIKETGQNSDGPTAKGDALRSQTGWYKMGLNSIGFSAIPAGVFWNNGHFDSASDTVSFDFWGNVIEDDYKGYPKNMTVFWNATGDFDLDSVCPVIVNGDVRFDICFAKDEGFSVRCVKDYD